MSFHMVDCAARVLVPASCAQPDCGHGPSRHERGPCIEPGCPCDQWSPSERLVPLEPSWKLVLMRFADSADTVTGIGFPGLDEVMAWSGLSRSRVYEVTNVLLLLGLLSKHRGGRNGRRAEYVVMPAGCCNQHRRPAPDDVIDPETTGSDGSDFTHGPGSDGSDPTDSGGQGPTDRTLSVRRAGPSGSDEGPTGRTPSITSTTSTTGGSTPTEPARDPATNTDEWGRPLSPHCRTHPDGTPNACAACAARRTRFETAELHRATARRRAESQEAIKADRKRKGRTADVDAASHAKAARQHLAEAKTGAA